MFLSLIHLKYTVQCFLTYIKKVTKSAVTSHHDFVTCNLFLQIETKKAFNNLKVPSKAVTIQYFQIKSFKSFFKQLK